MENDMHTEHGLGGAEIGTGLSILLTVVSFAKLPWIVAAAGEYLPLLQASAAAVATVCGVIVILEKVFKREKYRAGKY